MTARTRTGTARTAKPVKAKRATRPRYATKADIAQVTKALDRVRDDETRYMICMTLDLLTQSIADQEKEKPAKSDIAEMFN